MTTDDNISRILGEFKKLGKTKRDPQRIDKMLDLVKSIWKMNPDLRLTQLILNACKHDDTAYYIEDDILEESLKKIYFDKKGE